MKGFNDEKERFALVIGRRRSSPERLFGGRILSARQGRMRSGLSRSLAHLRGDKDPIAPNDRRRDAQPMQRNFPGDVLRAPADGKARFVGDPAADGTAPLRPIIESHAAESQDGDEAN